MADLKLFASVVKGYLLHAQPLSNKRRVTLEDLAIEVGFTREELSRKLNGKSNINENDVRNIVRGLSSFKAINSRGQAKYLLELMDAPDFPPADWQAEPL